MSPTVTVFIPAFNEADNLATSVEVLLAKMDELGVNAEILIVDDGSQDGTAQRADELACQLEGVRSTHHARNLGIGMSFNTAVELARGEWMIFIPADLALHPNELKRYFEAAPQADIVVGLRSDRSDYTWLRHLVSWTNIHLIQALFGMKPRQFQYISMYRLDVLRRINIEYWRSAFFLPEILIKARDLGCRLVEVEIRYAPRLSGKPTGAKLILVLLTVFDIFHFWIRWKSNRRKLESDLLFRPRRTRSP
jgi:glycosyltransferase involved in cell wall biosynthesis